MTRKTFLISIATIAILIPTILFAQDSELTLQSLSDRLDNFTAAITDLTGRTEALEALIAGPWSPGIIYTDDGICQSPLHAPPNEYADLLGGHLRQETADAYRTEYGTSIDPDDAYLHSISFGVVSDHVYLEYTINDRKVVEKWAHCEFLGHSEWKED